MIRPALGLLLSVVSLEAFAAPPCDLDTLVFRTVAEKEIFKIGGQGVYSRLSPVFMFDYDQSTSLVTISEHDRIGLRNLAGAIRAKIDVDTPDGDECGVDLDDPNTDIRTPDGGLIVEGTVSMTNWKCVDVPLVGRTKTELGSGTVHFRVQYVPVVEAGAIRFSASSERWFDGDQLANLFLNLGQELGLIGDVDTLLPEAPIPDIPLTYDGEDGPNTTFYQPKIYKAEFLPASVGIAYVVSKQTQVRPGTACAVWDFLYDHGDVELWTDYDYRMPFWGQIRKRECPFGPKLPCFTIDQ